MIAAAGVPVAVHAFLDGRDVPPQSAEGQIAELEAALPPGARIATVSGRFYAMDRDKRWERVAAAVAAILRGEGLKAPSAGRGDRGGLCARRDRRVRHADGDRRLCRCAGRRRAVLRQLPRRPGAADPQRAGRSRLRGVLRSACGRASRRCSAWWSTPSAWTADAGDVPVRRHRQHPRRLGRRQRAEAVPPGGDREVPARHLLPERRRRGAGARRDAPHGAEPEGPHLRPRARDGGGRGDASTSSRRSARASTRCRGQLRQPRHGRAHRDPRGGDQGGRGRRPRARRGAGGAGRGSAGR